jgi:hypothetical protein
MIGSSPEKFGPRQEGGVADLNEHSLILRLSYLVYGMHFET